MTYGTAFSSGARGGCAGPAHQTKIEFENFEHPSPETGGPEDWTGRRQTSDQPGGNLAIRPIKRKSKSEKTNPPSPEIRELR